MPGSPSATEVSSRDTSSVLSRGNFFLVVALLLLIVASALRVYHLGDRSLWYDEAVTANISRGTFTQVLKETRHVSAPVVHPYILHVAEEIGKGSIAARTPSVLASMLSVLMMLAMARAGVSQNAALLSAAILAVSESQIRYAQEVREYSLAVLCAAILVYCLLRWEVAGSRTGHPVYLYAVLFIAPLVQYGLVFLAFGILGTIALRLLLTRSTCFRLSHLTVASASLAVGALLTFILTLRYQFKPGSIPLYISGKYFDPKAMSLLSFVIANSRSLLAFLIPGYGIHLLILVCAIVFCVAQALTRKFESITLLVFTSLSITICASIARVYPYGGVRQCLFLAPVLTLFAGVAFAELLKRLSGRLQPVATVALLAFILVSLFRDTLKQWPYGEFEDTQSLLKKLAEPSASSGQVWVNHDAAPAFEFYLPENDHRFIYGKYHADVREYVPELFEAIDPHNDRFWLVFSHLEQASDRAEEVSIVSSLRSGWDVHEVVAATNAELYLAQRKTSP